MYSHVHISSGKGYCHEHCTGLVMYTVVIYKEIHVQEQSDIGKFMYRYNHVHVP